MRALLWSMIGGAGVYEAFQLYAGIDAARLLSVGAVLVTAGVAMIALRRGARDAAAWLASASLFGIACISLWLGGGLGAPGATTLAVVVLVSAMTLERRSTVLWTALSLAALAAFAFAQAQGWLAPPPPWTLPHLVFTYGIHLVAVAWLVSSSAGTMRGLLGRLGSRSEALAASESRYERLVAQSPDVIVELDRDGVVRECSPAVEAVFGYRPEELLGRPFHELQVVPADALDRYLEDFRILLEGEVPPFRAARVRHRDGGTRWVEANGRVEQRPDGTPRLHLVIRDATARVDAERRRATLEEQLAEARRMEALGRMAGALAHDFNNLLLVILSNAELLETGPDAGPDLAREIRVAGESAAQLTGQLLAFAGRQVQEVDRVDVSAALADMEGLLRRLLPPNVTLSIERRGGPFTARGDPSQLQQVLVNLVMNAQQAMPEGGAIRVETDVVQVTPQESSEHPGARPGPHVRIRVCDTGRGMDPRTLRQIFEPYYSQREGGTGLGLATVHGIVSQSEGHVRVHSRPGQGTRFDVLLPCMEAAAPAATPAPPRRRAASSEASVVLLVDDQPGVLNTLCRLLERRGCRVLRAASAESARHISESEPGPIDLLLTDVLMPGTSGPRLAAELLATRPEMKVLLMSGYAEDWIEERRLLGDVVHFLAKPFSGEELAERIRSIVQPDATPARSGDAGESRPRRARRQGAPLDPGSHGPSLAR